MCLSMKIYFIVLDCCIVSSHLRVSNITHSLALRIYCSLLGLCFVLIIVWFNHAASRNLLLPSDISSTQWGIMICCFCKHSISSNSCSTYAAHLRSTWYGLFPSLPCNETMPWKQPMHDNTSLKSLWIDSVSLALTSLSTFFFWVCNRVFNFYWSFIEKTSVKQSMKCKVCWNFQTSFLHLSQMDPP